MEKSNKTNTEEFKRHIVELHKSGKSSGELAATYQISKTTVNTWVKNFENSGNFKTDENLSDEKKKIKELEANLKDRQMEIDILKKAMVIMSKN